MKTRILSKKWMLLLGLCAAAMVWLFFSKPESAQAQDSGAWNYDVDQKDGTIVVSGYRGEAETLVIPSSIDGKPVTRVSLDLSGEAFYNVKGLKRVVIPDSVQVIDEGTFRNCATLEEVVIPQSVKEIWDRAFEFTTSLKKITIPEGVEDIGESAFQGCSKLEKVIIPESVKRIGVNAFKDCKKLPAVPRAGKT